MLPDAVFDLAAAQHGVVALHQAIRCDLDRATLRRHLETSGWVPRGSEVYVRRGAPPTAEQRVAIKVIGSGPRAWNSHQSGAHWWGIAGFGGDAVRVLTDRRTRRRLPADRVHRVDEVDQRWLRVHRGVPVCSPELVILQLCDVIHPDRAARALDNAWRLRLLSGRSLRALLDGWGRRGRNGTALLRELVDRRPDDYRPPESNLEDRAFQVLELAHVGEFRRQVDSGGERWTGRVDLRHARLPLIVEVQSEMYHSSLLDEEADAARRAQLERDGFVVVEVTDQELFHRRDALVRRVRDAVRELRKAG